MLHTTIKAINRVSEIKAKREKLFYKTRISAPKKIAEKQADLFDIKKSIELIQVPKIRSKEKIKSSTSQNKKMEIENTI